ncbi:hypothetical protein ACCO45_013803 [Purpureocillium lilacinum]|uniref:Uncharacterized protein n=1 Tax=Purpureocillium lilacinum TaxID=33203 RepID=A0ACC4D797_PURLI
MYEAEDASVAALRRAVCDAIARGALLDNPAPRADDARVDRALYRRASSPQALSQPLSFWDHDNSDESTNGVGLLGGRKRASCGFCSRVRRALKSKLVLACLAAATLIVAGAVVGGIFGVKAASHKIQTQGEPNGGSPQNPQPGRPQPGNPQTGNPQSGALAHNASQLAVWCQPGSSGTPTDHVIAFQDTTGTIVITETYKGATETYRLETQVARLPKPLLSTPIRIQPFGEAPDLHMFYLDDQRLVRHVTRVGGGSGKGKWALDTAFSTDGSGKSTQIYLAEGRALSTVATPMIKDGDPSALVVLYYEKEKNNTLGILRREAPFNQTQWTFQRAYVHEPAAKSLQGTPSVHFEHDSSGLQSTVYLPTYPTKLAGNSTGSSTEATDGTLVEAVVPTIHILWDHNVGSTVLEHDPFISRRVPAKKVRDAQKPLQIADLDLESEPDKVISVTGFLDGGGRYWEMYWKQENCTAAMDLSPETVRGPLDGLEFSSFAFMQDLIVFALRNGTLLLLRRECSWWTGFCKDSKAFSYRCSANSLVDERRANREHPAVAAAQLQAGGPDARPARLRVRQPLLLFGAAGPAVVPAQALLLDGRRRRGVCGGGRGGGAGGRAEQESGRERRRGRAACCGDDDAEHCISVFVSGVFVHGAVNFNVDGYELGGVFINTHFVEPR